MGHSTRGFEELAGLLTAFEIGVLADIRTVPRSRKNPQFNADALPAALAPYAIDYAHLPRLGGLRHARKTRKIQAGATRVFAATPTTS